jgi:hypothetical protein
MDATPLKTYRIVPGHLRFAWLIVAVLLVGAVLMTKASLPGSIVMVFAAALVGFSMLGSALATFQVTPAGLRLRGDLYGRLIPAQQLRGNAAEIVDLTSDRARQPVWRTFGTAVPGYQAGWFKLQNGEKALLYITDRSRVAYVPTTEDYAVMLSVEDPAAFIASVRDVAPNS